MISVTITDKSGRTLSGQTVEAFWISVAHARPLSRRRQLRARRARDAAVRRGAVAHRRRATSAATRTRACPTRSASTTRRPETTSALVRELRGRGPGQHRRRLLRHDARSHPRHRARASSGVAPRTPPEARAASRASRGLEPLVIRPDSNFIMIGERTNVTGSPKFAELVKAGDYAKAVEVALDQVRGGANILDVNMDEGMLEGERAMTTFLNLLATEPEIARIPVMVDSSKWTVIEAGLKCLQGKGIVNSISLKEGEEDFLAKARKIRALRRRRRRHGLRREGAGRDGRAQGLHLRARLRPAHARAAAGDPTDIIFDPNILAIATGIEEHADFARNFIEATRVIKDSAAPARRSPAA